MPSSKLDNLTKNALVNLVKQNQRDIDQLKKSFANKANLLAQSGQPTLDVNSEFLFWRDTDDGKVYLIQRANDSDKKVELT